MDNFKVTFIGKMKNGLLWEGVKQLGTQGKLAEYLGVSQSKLGLWLNMKEYPSAFYIKKIEEKLLQLTGKLSDDIFPEALNSQDFLDKNKNMEITKDMPISMLIESGLTNKALPQPDDEFFEKEQKAIISEVLESLTPRESKVLQMSYGLDGYDEHSLQAIGDMFGVTRERIRNIQSKAIHKLQHSRRGKRLRALVEGEDEECGKCEEQEKRENCSEYVCNDCGRKYIEGSPEDLRHLSIKKLTGYQRRSKHERNQLLDKLEGKHLTLTDRWPTDRWQTILKTLSEGNYNDELSPKIKHLERR